MGSSSSKASRAAGAAARQYPKRPPQTSQATPSPQVSNAGPAPVPNAPSASASPAPAAPAPGPSVKPPPSASGRRDAAINLDASDPDFARSLRSLGPVQPSPTQSPSSTFNQGSSPQRLAPNPRTNPAIMILDARSRLQEEAENEFENAGRKGTPGRQFLDVYTIRQILHERDKMDKSAAEIERNMGLRQGVVERLGAQGVFGLVQEIGRGRKDVDIV